MRRLLLAVLVILLVVGTGLPPVRAQSGAVSFFEAFDGQPSSPQPWTSPRWDLTVHSRDHDTWASLEAMQAHHSTACGAPPATHPITAYDDAVFQCSDHLMTAIKAAGYGMIYLTPNHLADFSAGEAVVRFDVSTLRSSGRDFIDLWITPYDEHLQLTLRDDLPDAQGEPRNAVHIEMDFGLSGTWKARVIRNHVATQLDGPGTNSAGYETWLTPSASRRDSFELRISRTSIKFGMPTYGRWWVDETIPDLGWDRGVVQLGHHSYNPQKDCEAASPCLPNTWHWNNVQISPAVPFTILQADRRYVGPGTPASVEFSAPAPSGSKLRFAGIGNNLEISADNGATWQPAVRQPQELNKAEAFASFFTPIPAGTTSVMIRGQNWWGGQWRVRDISAWSLAAQVAPSPTATVPPTLTMAPTATLAPSNTPLPPTLTPTATSTVTLTPAPSVTQTPIPPTATPSNCTYRVFRDEVMVSSWSCP